MLCTTEAERIELALARGFATQAEREYAQLVSIEFGGDWPCWTLRFDLTAYHEALAKL
ncbi:MULTISPECIES: hypothetical protein [Mycolicibacter]|uniref:Uncharacterized protein n=2 Tax=Mycolicibacter TaxID=1073531 RepID=A0ABU5XMI1_9MYCO|nr:MULTISPECIES: hypothetical protein [unclassified Mycolicibacter]MEB3023409.1 hypothetical protein [Mycolicibacter sp. MYC098]MEB3033751.1 hypothetical protein [Mycolicibacter sp. MYC340]